METLPRRSVQGGSEVCVAEVTSHSFLAGALGLTWPKAGLGGICAPATPENVSAIALERTKTTTDELFA